MVRRLVVVGATALFALAALLPAGALALDRLATSSAVTVSPTTGNGNTLFEVRAKVTPVPDGGYVRLSSWTAEAGGELIYSMHMDLNANGVAVLTNMRMPAGYNWWEAEYSGNSYFAPSTSPRTPVQITGIATSLSEVSFTTEYNIGISARASVSYGELQLYVDGEVLAVCGHGRSSDLSSCATENTFPPGAHEVWLKLIPEDGRYLPSRTETFTFFNGPPLPPSDGILVEANAFSTRFRDVTINVSGFDQGVAVAEVRLSNTSTIAGDGLLADGITVDYQPTLAWSLASGADGHRVVWAQLIREDGSVSDAFNDSIYLDTTAPTGSFVINDDAASFGDAWTCSYEGPVLSGSVGDASLAEGGRLTHIAISNDGQQFVVRPYTYGDSFQTAWGVIHGGYGANDLPGTHTVYMRWRDAAGNWSDVTTDSIVFNACGYLGRVLIDGEETGPPDPSYRSSPTVEVKIEVWNIPPAGYRRVRLSHDIWDGPAKSFAWPDGATSLTLDWSLIDPDAGYPTADGFRNITAELITNDGYKVHIGAMVILDRVVPTSNVPIPGFALNTTVSEVTTVGATAGSTGSAEFAADIKWTGQDGASSYELDRLVNGTWRDVDLGRADATWVRQTVENGSSNQFRVKAVDAAGNASAWKNGAAFTATARQESEGSVTYRGAWRSESGNDAFGGTQRTTVEAGASVKTTFTGRAIAWVAARTPGGGKAYVYVDGKLIKTVSLAATTAQPRRIVFSKSWKSAGTHTIKIVKTTSSGAVYVDAFLVLS